MGSDIAGAVAEFIGLNDRFLGDELAGHERDRWGGLALKLDATAVSLDARTNGGRTRRRHARAPLRCHVDFLRPPAVGGAETLDLSCGGCAVEAPCRLGAGDEIEIAIRLPARREALRASGRVCWATPARAAGRWRAGVTFLGLSPDERDLVAACVLGELAPRLGAAA
ncbi:MAG: PilZ domain-containing protein [Deltaproteobacteria bacterium]|nr:PilZ domain-containing protein [Deltaproteobacteria bacterium]